MKICAACTLELPKESFDDEQWQMMLHRSRCTTCISDERAAQLSAPECWICKEGEAEQSECLRRDCSCRGADAGFVHLSCLVRYAEKKNQEWDDRNPDDREFGGIREPWEVCPNCLQDYQNTMSVDIANEFLSFVDREHPNDEQKQVEALNLKLWLLLSTVGSSRQTLIISEAKEVASRVLTLIHQMKVETHMLPTRYMQIEALTYNDLGMLALREGTPENSAQEAVLHFEKYLELSTAVDFTVGIANAEYNIAFAKSTYESCDDARHKEERLRKSRDLYELRVTKHGEGNALAINEGLNLAIALWGANRGIEAERLLTRVAAISRRVHGPQHKLTENVELDLRDFQVREVMVQVEGEWKHFQVLQYEANEDIYVIQGPLAKPRNIRAEMRSTVAANNVRLVAGTPVVCHGLKDESSHLNENIADLKYYCDEADSYEIHFEDKLEDSLMVNVKNLRIVMALPEK